MGKEKGRYISACDNYFKAITHITDLLVLEEMGKTAKEPHRTLRDPQAKVSCYLS
ncbi:hypothetical protein J4460_07775 [Candidatus Woesearchaeota archaeon]|nr:hypothetical protein [Candidatus Woesearchaeota archaeon]HIH38017.1 hypothetical protein [Candidatus Woesearchaeota archaeon]HIJ02986.1 hypothetical protein [Candidatus Woesearchaeota archaeon]